MRKLLPLALALAALALPQTAATQDAWPSKPIRLIVPFAPGGNTDVVGRITAEHLRQRLGVAVVVENRAGGGGIVGTHALVNSAPDGYTFCVCGSGPIAVVSAIEKLPYDPLKDLVPISLVNTNPLILLVHPSVPAKSVKDLIELAKQKPGALNYGSPGVGGLIYFSAELFQSLTGTKMVNVAYRGGALATAALVSGEVQVLFANMSDALPQMEAGKVRALAVTTRERSSQAPDIPTIAEAGVPGYHVESWNGIFAPVGTPQAIVDRMAKALADIPKDEATAARIRKVGSEPAANAPAAFADMIRKESALWVQVVERAGIKTR
jgi:tripartite-type tricarboxylate transporter receptor subunit TctC